MSLPIYNFPDHVKGDTFTARQIIFSSETANAPVDLTGAGINIQFKENPSTPTAYFWSTSDNSIILTDAPNGIITMNAKILDAPASTYVYDVQIVDNTGMVKTYFKGSMKITQDITI